MRNALLVVLGVETLPPGQTEHDVVEKLLRDPDVCRIAHDLATRNFAFAAIRDMPPSKKSEVRQRYGLGDTPTVRVFWNVGQTPTGEQWFIRAQGHSQEIFFTGKPVGAYTFQFCGETCPRDVADEYARVYKAVGFAQDGAQAGQFTKAPGAV